MSARRSQPLKKILATTSKLDTVDNLDGDQLRKPVSGVI